MNPTSPRIMTFLPVVRTLNPGHDLPQNTDPPVLDLCIRKKPASPNYPYDYVSSKCPPMCAEPPHISSPRLQSDTSETSEVSSSENKDLNANCTTLKVKPSRPFKAYPKDPLSIALMGTTTDILGKDSAEAYAEFRQKMLTYVQAGHNGTNKNMRRTQSQKSHVVDPTYWEKRKKNNEAAKRSRDARRAKEDEIAIRCAFLEQENIQLKFQIATLENEKERLQSMIYH